MGLFKQEYDPEVNLWVAQRAKEVGEEVRNAKYRKGMLSRRKKPITIYDQYGKPAAVIRVNDMGSTEHEFDNHQDAAARPHAASTKSEVGRKLWTPRRR